MSKKLLSTLIASLFAAAPALAQSDGPDARRGLGDPRGHIQRPERAGPDEARGVPGPAQRRDVQRRRPRPQQHDLVHGYGENFGRSDQYMFLRGGMYDFFKAGRVPQRHPAQLPHRPD